MIKNIVACKHKGILTSTEFPRKIIIVNVYILYSCAIFYSKRNFISKFLRWKKMKTQMDGYEKRNLVSFFELAIKDSNTIARQCIKTMSKNCVEKPFHDNILLLHYINRFFMSWLCLNRNRIKKKKNYIEFSSDLDIELAEK